MKSTIGMVKLHTALMYVNIWVFLIILSIQAYSHNEQGCLTWEISRNRLILTCRLTHFSKPVFFIDNHEQEYIHCTLKEKINNCISRHASQSIFINSSINTITLTIRKINENNVDGKWRCKQGKHDYETEVAIAKGIISATDIHLNGELLNTGTSQKVKLKCYSCREPRKNYIEFLINGSTVDGISYNKTIDKCSHRDGECKSHVCACHRAGNEFIRIFNVTSFYGTQYSCDMRFNDKDKESIFSMERSLYINDTEFYNTSEIKLIKPPSRGNDKKIRTEDTANLNEKEITLVGTWIGISVSLLGFLTFLALLIIYVIWRTTIQKESGKSKNYDDQINPLLGKSKEFSTNSGTEDKVLYEETSIIEKASIPVDNQVSKVGNANIREYHTEDKQHANTVKTFINESELCDNDKEATCILNDRESLNRKIAQLTTHSDSEQCFKKEDIDDSTTATAKTNGKTLEKCTESSIGQRKLCNMSEKMNEKTADNSNSEGKPRDKETETTKSERNICSKAAEICDQNSDIESKSYDKNRQTTMDDSIPFKEAGETTTSEYCSYANVTDMILSENELFDKTAETTLSKNKPNGSAVETAVREDKELENAKEPSCTVHYEIYTMTEDISVRTHKPFDDANVTTGIEGKSWDKAKQTLACNLQSCEHDKETNVIKDTQYAIAEENIMNKNAQQDISIETTKALNLQGDTDAKGQLTSVLQHDKIYEPKMTVVFDEQQEQVPEAQDIYEGTQHKNDMEFILAEGIKTEGNLNELSNLCQPCKTTSINIPACYWCRNCEEAVCECCKENDFNTHTFEKISSPHVLIKILNRCGNHHDRQYEYFCKNHNSLCCVECRFIEHCGCLDITRIVDASEGFKSSKDVDEYKKVLKKFSKSFDNLKDILKTGKQDVQKRTYDVQSEIETNCHLWVKSNQLKHVKLLFPEHVRDYKNTCLLKLQKQISVVSKCKTFINTIEADFERNMEHCPEEKLFLMVYISIKFLESTLKKAISESESINLVFNPMLVGGKNVMFGFREKEKVLPQNLLALLSGQKRAE